ncbi:MULTISPECIES: DUF421 domain-containing protein [Ornithinibacillus]|uniref:DUF421 domain-containing protein n=2 Tax=Ornithinibacillus TaxID=484508 RepID=A0A923RGT8_9BACI|nr:MULTISPECIES: DUF421 domain-containing protein [Ornithinibacillus]MBC5635783.1 DUF421 domain-containing protein [Ornithinibacillus hominis]MBS3680228.1 DUF421 domain-containing protein [Ornithinibacillus massiliensis]
MADWIQIALRSITLLTILFLFTKWLGTKQLSQLNIFEYISGVVLGGIVAIHVSTLDSPFYYALISMFVWFIIPYAVEYFALKSKVFRNFAQGKSTVLIQNGKIMEDNLKKEHFSTDDLLESLRDKNIFKVADVEFAVLEPTGKLSVLPKTENRPLTAKDIGLKVAPDREPQTVIMDGRPLLEPLANLSLNPKWLETELEKMNISMENVYLGQVDSDGQLTVDLYDDKLTVPSPTQKPLLLATMKKCQADLELFALSTNNQETKQLYQRNSEKMQKAIDLVSTYLK